MRRCSIALLGGIGSGKSSVGQLLAGLGAEVIDADAIGHEVLLGPARDAVGREWPSTLVNGHIDRRRLAAIVFSDQGQLNRLESITHPHIRSRISDLADESTADIVVVELPVLGDMLEGRWMRVVVDAPDDVRIERLIGRGMTRRDVLARMKSQPSRVAWLAAADFVVDNGGDPLQLPEQVSNLLMMIDGCSESTE